jgi:hypothetical protein
MNNKTEKPNFLEDHPVNAERLCRGLDFHLKAKADKKQANQESMRQVHRQNQEAIARGETPDYDNQ